MDTSRSSPTPDSPGAIEDAYHRDKFDRSVMAHVVGTLLAWVIGLLVFLMYKLWQDYISTILTAFIVSQTLHSHRARIVGTLQWLRSPTTPSLLHLAFAAARQPWRLLQQMLYEVPPLVQLTALLFFFLVHNVYTWAYILLALLGPALALLLACALLDKRLLATNALLSDEVHRPSKGSHVAQLSPLLPSVPSAH